MVTDQKQLSYWLSEVNSAVDAIGVANEKFGLVLIAAGKNLSHDDYKELIRLIKLRGVKDADIKAAQVIAHGELPATLFHYGVSASKILTLPEEHKARLAADEEFEVRIAEGDGAEAHKRVKFSQMMPVERNQIVGPKGRSILSWQEQSLPGKKSSNSFRKVKYDTARFEDTVLTLKSREAEGEIDIAHLVAMPSQQRRALAALLNAR